jgi:hypothetical protein
MNVMETVSRIRSEVWAMNKDREINCLQLHRLKKECTAVQNGQNPKQLNMKQG